MAKQKIELIAGKKTYQTLSTFTSLKQLNQAVRVHKETHKKSLNKTDIILLDILQQHSCHDDHRGVSFLAKNNIANMMDCSRKTVIRKCQKLEDLGIIKQHEMKRGSDMRQTSNAITIMPIQQPDVAQETEKVSQHKNKFLLKLSFFKPLNNINHLNIEKQPSNRNAYVKMVPKRLQHFQAFFGKEIKALYGRVWLAAKKLGVKVEQGIMQEIAHITFNKLVEYMKQGRTLSVQDMAKIVFTIATNQLKERSDTKDLVQKAKENQVTEFLLDRLSKVEKPEENKPNFSVFKSLMGTV